MKDFQIYVYKAQGAKESTTSAAVACNFAMRFLPNFANVNEPLNCCDETVCIQKTFFFVTYEWAE